MTGTKELTKFIQDRNWKLAELQLRNHPNQAKTWSIRPGFFEGIKESEVLPIHEACAFVPPVSFINAMGITYRKSFRLRESAYRRLPIHIACRAGSDVNVINAILKYNIEGAATDDNLGRLPIHYALSNGAAEDVVFALIKACQVALVHMTAGAGSQSMLRAVSVLLLKSSALCSKATLLLLFSRQVRGAHQQNSLICQILK